MNKVCEKCNKQYEGEKWTTVCKSCFSEMKKAEKKPQEEMHLTKENQRALALDSAVKTQSMIGGAEPEVIIETAMRYEKYIITGD